MKIIYRENKDTFWLSGKCNSHTTGISKLQNRLFTYYIK